MDAQVGSDFRDAYIELGCAITDLRGVVWLNRPGFLANQSLVEAARSSVASSNQVCIPGLAAIGVDWQPVELTMKPLTVVNAVAAKYRTYREVATLLGARARLAEHLAAHPMGIPDDLPVGGAMERAMITPRGRGVFWVVILAIGVAWNTIIWMVVHSGN